jgi:hypothetical protein
MGGLESSFLKHSVANSALGIIAARKRNPTSGRHQRAAETKKRLLLCEEWQRMTLDARLRMGVTKTVLPVDK